jgi:D-alanyl-D-alanine carboxypeptidase (penicillin-binding protein 5/6)
VQTNVQQVSQPRFVSNPPDAPRIRSQSYLLVDATSGVPIVAHDADEPRSVASTQKILMALVVLDQGNLDKRVTIASSDKEVGDGGVTVKSLRVGDTATRRQLLTACLVKSANDMVQALARDCAGSQERFMGLMNAKARELGMNSSHFVNPHGMPASGQHSTARDMARCSLMAYRSQFIRDAVRRSSFSFSTGAGRTVSVETTNLLLGRMPECNGLKTGYTAAAGPCLISSAARNGRAVILIQLHSQEGRARWDDAKLMLDWGLRKLNRG